ncbi:MAG TPA: carboxypeptidase regulatory-like domain-containing protein [Gemmatimonadaceae bacterium]|nr:carboxypeptidase regulatory-like domain-containing protein [Gemmatimonadaceae bacterium]
MMRRVDSSYRCLLALLTALVLSASQQLNAQAQATTGVIRGTTTDSIGRPISANVAIRNTETNFTRTIKSSDQGVFVATLLPLGNYTVTARAVGYTPDNKSNLQVNVGQTLEVDLRLARAATELAAVSVLGERTLEATKSAEATRLPSQVVSGLPNNGRNYLNLMLLTPNVAITQGPDGDVFTIGGQRGIHNNVSVDGADFNNPFFGEQRGGQRPPFTFNLDAVREMVVVAQGANAEFGRSSGGFVNVITKSGTNQTHGTIHYFGKDAALSSDAEHANVTLSPDFTQHQFGVTLGGPVVKDKFFYFLAYDQQVYDEIKQKTRPSNAAFDSLNTYLNTAFGGALNGDFGPISRTNDAQVAMVKLDWRVNPINFASLKYNFTNSRQENGTFDVDSWARSANAVEKDYSHAVNGSLVTNLTSNIDNEFRFQLAREDRPRPYAGPEIPGQGRPFSDTGMDFGNGFRFGMPFFIPVKAHDTRIQALDNISLIRGNHIFKTGFEWNRTAETQTFVGFGNGRFIFNSVTGFENYVTFGPNYVECSNAAGVVVGTSIIHSCAAFPGTSISGPLLLYLQQVGVGGRSVEEAGTQNIPQHDLSAYIQDSWKATPNLTVNYGLRWEAQVEPDPITPPSQVFFSDFIGKTVTNSTGTYTFPSDGKIPSDWKMFQPRLGIAWDIRGDGRDLVRASAGLYYARIPGLNLASTRSTNGSIGQTLAAASFFGAPPAYNQLLAAPSGSPDHPSIFVFDKDFENPRTFSTSIGYEKEIFTQVGASVSYTFAATDNLTRFIDRNDAVFGSPWSTGLNGTANGVGTLTTIESSAKSRYNGVTFALTSMANPIFQYQANYTLSVDKSDDDNERDPFSFRYARANRLDREYNYSDRDQRHRLNLWALYKFPFEIYANNRFSWYSAQPTSEKCGANNEGTGQRAVQPSDRICPNGTILLRNTIRRDNAFASWDIRLSRPFKTSKRGQLEALVEVFNVLNRDNFRDPSSASLLFNFDGTIRSGLGDPRQIQVGLRYGF